MSNQLSKAWGSALVAALMLVPPAPAQTPGAPDQAAQMVTVVGKATGTGLKAEEQATLDAQRKAVEQVCGTFINSMSQTENYQTVYDKILAQAAGFARLVKVVEQEESDGMTFVKAQIEVFPARFKQKWLEFAHVKEAEDNPRCILIVIEDNDTTDRKPPRTNGVVQSQLEGFFIGKDVQLMDKTVSDEVRRRDLELAAVNDDINKLAAAGAAFKAEVVVLGRAEATPAGFSEIGGLRAYKWRTTLTIRAIQTDSAKILMSRQYQLMHTTTASSGGGDPALEKVAKENQGKILLDIAAAWRKRASDRRIIRLTLRPMSYAQALMFTETLKKLDGTAGAKLREVVQNSADIEVDWKNKIDDLAAELMKMQLDEGEKIEITERTANRLFGKVLK
ncbi:MAG: hypothetical protein JXQ73_03485 [Phycisphaerae bacterium]|nr:hypothetical protein [Phycisphaerae bacterium]